MGRRGRPTSDVFFIQRDRANLAKKVPYFLLGITALLSMNILLLLQQQPSSDGLPMVQTELLEVDHRQLRQYVEPDERRSYPVRIPAHKPPPTNEREIFNAVREKADSVTAKADSVTTKAAADPSTTSKKPTTAKSALKLQKVTSKPLRESEGAAKLVITGSSPRSTLPPLKKGSYVTPNEILQRTAVAIKTFNRAECLMTTVASFKESYPDIPVFVADDSFEDSVSENLTKTYDITYIRLPVDSGVGFGRNRLVEHIYKMGYQYMLMSDDDYTLDQQDLLLMMADKLIKTGAHAIAPLRCDYGKCARSKGMIHMNKNGELTVFPNISSYPSQIVPTCDRSDLMQQFFIAETETLMKVHWDDKLKNNDHYDFLFSAKRHDLKLVTCNDIKVLHNKKICQDKVAPELMESYLEVRAARWLNLTSYVFSKWNISLLYDETGKTIQIDKQTGAPVINPVQRVVVDPAHPNRAYFEQAILDHYNNKNPGWYSIRSKPNSRKTYIVYKQLNRCMYWLGGKLDTEYDRHASFPNKNQLISFEFHHINSSCSTAEDFWMMKKFGKLHKRHVYLITAVSNDAVHMDRLLSFVNNQTNRQHVTFVVVDMGKDTDKYDLSKHTTLVDTKYLYLGGPFSRSIGLKKGFDYAKELAESRQQKDAIGFSIDTSIIIPNNFSDIIRSHVRCGLSSFAPVCYKHKDPGGYWVTTGYGMIGACFDDYAAIGGWDTRWGYKWGAEDVDIMNRMQKHLPLTVRTKENNFEHKHSGTTRNKNEVYYKNKNLYDGDLPVTPLTTKLNDTTMSDRLFKWAQPKMRYHIPLTHHQIFVTHNPVSGKKIYDIRYFNSKKEEYYAVVESLL